MEEAVGQAPRGASQVTVRIGLLDESPLVHLGLAAILDPCSDLQLVAAAQDLDGMLHLLERRALDILLLDPWTPRGGGRRALEHLRALDHPPRLVILSAHDGHAQLHAGAELGDGQIGKNSPPGDLPSLLRHIANGHSVSPRASIHPHPLTRREVEVLRLAADGQSNAQIGATLFVTEQTCKFHLSNIYRKLGEANRTAAARRARELGIID